MSVSCFRRPLLLALIVTCGVSVPVLAQTPPATTTPVPTVTPEISPALPGDSSAIRALVSGARHPSMRFGQLADVADDLRRLYDSAAWQPRWIQVTNSGGSATYKPSQSAVELVASANLVLLRGLDPADYDVDKLPSYMLMLGTPAERAEYDVAFSANAIRIVRALHEGRLKPSEAHAELRIPRMKFDASAVVRAMADSAQTEKRLDATEPPFIHYQLLKKALSRYRLLRADSAMLHLPALAKKQIIHPGESYAGTSQLRKLLTAVGDLPIPSYGPNPDSTLLLGDVLEGLRRFQKRTGLEADGNIGPMTISALKRPFDARVRTIELSLERWRWLPHTFVAPPILVNLPAFRLYAFRSNSDDESELLTMDVAIGGSFDKKTPIFSDTLRTVVFSPYWDVPISISREEIIPKAREDIGYLAKNRYEIVRGDADNSPVVPSSNSALDMVLNGSARIRQMPGANNSLGGVKFLFPNSYNIYFHDTPSRKAFEKARRDVSHGCIRLSQPALLAALLLSDQPEWTPAVIDSSMKMVAPKRVAVKQPRPVFILYSTAMATQDGQTSFYPDIYGYDKELIAKLQKSYPYAH
ncbi:MAG: L,D-transpeptidase family protein [Phycisphaerae bacterium]|nr:L,D-transpeptidase family protein [Gemmatimonadaceae bacterium]